MWHSPPFQIPTKASRIEDIKIIFSLMQFAVVTLPASQLHVYGDVKTVSRVQGPRPSAAEFQL